MVRSRYRTLCALSCTLQILHSRIGYLSDFDVLRCSSNYRHEIPLTDLTIINSNVPLVTRVGYSSVGSRTGGPHRDVSPPAGGEYVVGNVAGNYWRTQLSLRYSF